MQLAGDEVSRAVNILLIGGFGWGFTGEEAALEVLLRDLPRVLPGCRVTVTSGDPNDTHARHGASAVSTEDPGAVYQAIAKADLVIVGGGAVVDDRTPFARARPGVDPLRLTHLALDAPHLAAFNGKPAVFLGAGLERLGSEEGRNALRDAFRAVVAGSVRDTASRVVLANAGPDLGDGGAACDPAAVFDRPPALPKRAFALSANRPVLALAFHQPSSPELATGWEATVAAAAAAFMDRYGAQVLLVPLRQDLSGAPLPWVQDVAGRLAGRGFQVMERPPTPANVVSALGVADVALTMPYHGGLLAFAAKTPPVEVALRPGEPSSLPDAGFERFLLDHASGAAAMAAALSDAFEERSGLRARMAQVNAERAAAHDRSLALLAEASSRRPSAPDEVTAEVARRWMENALWGLSREDDSWYRVLFEAASYGEDKVAVLNAVEDLAVRHSQSLPLRYYRAFLRDNVLGATERTDEDWRLLVDAGFNTAWTLHQWGSNLNARGRLEEAADKFRRVLAMAPDHSDAAAVLKIVEARIAERDRQSAAAPAQGTLEVGN